MLIWLFKQSQTAVHSGKIDICHLFCYGDLRLLSIFVKTTKYTKAIEVIVVEYFIINLQDQI